MGNHFSSGGGLIPGPGHMTSTGPVTPGITPGTSPAQAQVLRMLDMTSNGGYQQRQQLSPGDTDLVSSSPPPTSPRSSSPPPSQSLPPPRPPPPGHLQLPSPHLPGHPKSDNYKPVIGSSASQSSSCFPSNLPLFSSQSMPPDPFSALQDLRLSHPSISQWLQHQVSSNSLKPEPVSPRLDHQPSSQSSDFPRN